LELCFDVLEQHFLEMQVSHYYHLLILGITKLVMFYKNDMMIEIQVIALLYKQGFLHINKLMFMVMFYKNIIM
jgi:hypothetical protein